LTSKANVDLSFECHNGTFLFSQKHANDTTVLVQIELLSANNRDAQALAASLTRPTGEQTAQACDIGLQQSW